MKLLQLSAAQGPIECCRAVALAARKLQEEAAALEVRSTLLEHLSGAESDTLSSMLFALEGSNAELLTRRWSGTMLWICASPFRPHHRRKNWYFGGVSLDAPKAQFDQEIRFEAMRASGPGGQHLNTTDSAIRATHIASGISVKVQSERSQHANKKLATLLLAQRLAEQQQQILLEQKSERRQFHHELERGNPVRVFVGAKFIEQA